MVQWLSEPYTLQVDTDGMAGVIGAGIDGIYFNRLPKAPFWYTISEETAGVEVRHSLRSELEMEEVSTMNTLLDHATEWRHHGKRQKG